MADDVEAADTRLMREAKEVEDGVRALYRLLRRPFDPDIAASGLTAPQMGVLEELTREDGLSVKVLSKRRSLSHSTVSGILDRLQQRGLVERARAREDRRYSRIFLSEGVKDYIRHMSPSRRFGPIPKALGRADAEERAQILVGIGTLKRLLEEIVAEGGDEYRSALARREGAS